MRIDVSELLKEVGRSVEVKEQLECSYSEDGLNLKSPVNVAIRLVNTGPSILLTGSLDTRVVLICVRCLKEFEAPLHVELDEEFNRLKAKSGPHGGEVKLTEKDFVFSLEDKHVLGLEEVIRQNLILALPLKAVCSDGCRGGLAKEKEKEKLDPRLEPLKKMFKKEGK